MLSIRSSYEVARELLGESHDLRCKIEKAQYFVNCYDPERDAKYCLLVGKIKRQIEHMRAYHGVLVERLQDLIDDDISLGDSE